MTVVHRYGRIAPGERIVLVAVSAAHRGAAFGVAANARDLRLGHAGIMFEFERHALAPRDALT